MIQFRNSNQLKSFLKNESVRLNIGIPNTYNTYFSRTFLEAISYQNKGLFLVKGSFSQYVHIGKMVRPITDIDLVSERSNDDVVDFIIESINHLANNQFGFQINSVSKPSPNNVVEVKGQVNFDDIYHPINLDVKGDCNRIYEVAYKPVVPIFKGDETYYINTPSMEEHLAEKLCIIAEMITRGGIVSRMKDFYDVYQLHGGSYDFEKLSMYFYRMMIDRAIVNLHDVTTEPLTKAFTKEHQLMWEQMKHKYEFLEDISVEEAVFYTRAVLSEQLQKAKKYELKI